MYMYIYINFYVKHLINITINFMFVQLFAGIIMRIPNVPRVSFQNYVHAAGCVCDTRDVCNRAIRQAT